MDYVHPKRQNKQSENELLHIFHPGFIIQKIII